MEERAKQGPVYEWTLVISLALMFGFVGLNRVGIGYVLPPIVQEFHLEFWQAGLLVSGTSLAWAVSAWLSGCVSDRVGRKNVLLIGMYAATAISAVLGLAWNFLSLFIIRDLLGFGDGVSLTTGQSTIAERTNPNRRALYQGIFNGGYTLFGLGIGAFIITHLSTAFGWRWVFTIVAIFGAIMTTALIFILPKDLPASARSAAGQLNAASFVKDLKEILGSPGMARVAMCSTLGLGWLGLNIAFSALFLTQVRGYTLNEAGNILAISAVIGVSGVVFIPAIADRLGRKAAGIIASIGAGVCFLIFALIPLPTTALIVVLTLGSVCASGLAPLTLATLPSELVPLRRGAAIGVANLFAASFGITLSPIIGGILADHSSLIVPVLLGGLCQLAIAPILVGIPETAPRILARRSQAQPAGVEGAMPI
jgi:MFS family permease